MYFVSEIIKLKHSSGKDQLTISDGVYAHAAIMQAISQEDAEVGQLLHDLKRHKHLTLAIAHSRCDSTNLRLTFIDKKGLHYATLLAQRLLSQPILQIGRTTCEVIAVDVNEPKWGRICTWADFAGGENTNLHFKFVTPTAITQRGRNGLRFMAVFPDPGKVFSGLAKRWLNLSGPPLPNDLNDFLNSGGCVISSHCLRTTRFKAGKRTQIGFIGTAVYECLDKTPEYVAALNGLTKFAFFSGVGYQTTRGMGMVQTHLGHMEEI